MAEQTKTSLQWNGWRPCAHNLPNRGEQMVRYYGYYSNVARGKRKETGTDDAIPCILEPEGNAKALRKSWARLIQKIYANTAELKTKQFSAQPLFPQ